jgi:CRISPR/Cas system-associated protein Cas10 (large subunit of type III CRISPR-Cas system)
MMTEGATTEVRDREELFKVLEIAEARRRFHHEALWEEEKHFSWWASDGEEVLAHRELGDETIFGRLDEARAQERGERAAVMLVQDLRIDAELTLGCPHLVRPSQ